MSMYSAFVKYISYPLINYRDGIKGIYSHLKQLEQTQYMPYDQLKELQFLKLKRILTHAYTHCEYYKRRFDEIHFNPTNLQSPEDVKNIPLLTKKDIRLNLPKMLARSFSEKELHSSETGGTTGVKIQFYRDNYCLAPKTAATTRHQRWAGCDIGERMGLVWPAQQDYVGQYTFKAKLKNSLTQRLLTLPAAVLTDEDIYHYCLKLRKLKPPIIRCFPYALYLVSEFINRNSFGSIPLKGVVSTGEPLYDHQRKSIEKAFNCKVFDSYESRETGLISQECEYHNGLHINMESIFVEFLADNGGRVKKGESGRIIITDLLNYGMPMIRYDIGDLGIPSNERCSCGRGLPLMRGIQGRVVDEITVPSGKKVSSITLVLYLVDNGPPVGQVQIIQDAMDHFTIKMTKDPEPDESVFQYYRDTAKQLLGEAIKISFDIVDSIPREPSGKYRFVKSLI